MSKEKNLFENPEGAQKHLRKIPLNIWPAHPDDPRGLNPEMYPRRPLPVQEELWFEYNRPHWHTLDIILLLGGTRGGKTKGAVGRCLWAAKQFPNSVILVGSTDYGHLERTVIPDYEKLLTVSDPKVIEEFGLRRGSWNHPFLKAGKEPKKHHKQLECVNGSILHFMGIDDPGRVLSMEIDVFHFEEPQRLRNLAEFFEVSFTRLSGTAVPWKQTILTANPNDDLGILWEKFDLDQCTPDYDGDKRPIGRPCDCHLCQKCMKKGKKIPFVGETCPACANTKKTECLESAYFPRNSVRFVRK